MADNASVWSWVRATSLILLVALGVVACQGKIGGDSAEQSQTSGGAGGMVSVNSPCPLGQTSCDGRCVDTATDAAHCGSCTQACGAGDVCEMGACQALCAQGDTLCGTSCVSMQSDSSNCGACGKACPTGQFCSDGACSTSCAHQICEPATGAQQCVDVNTSPDNCGACNAACAAGQSCVAGACQLLCPDGRSACSGQCVVLSTDSSNCGACGNACTAAQGCVDGACGCHAGQTLCSGVCTDTSSDAMHCGNCTTTCSSDMLCNQGVCTPKATGCSTGLTTCGGSCVDLQSNASHCGTCDIACPNTQACAAGQCACPNSGTLCDAACVDTQSNDAHCGDCATTCSGGEHCSAGKCACPAGQVVCSGACVDPLTSNDDCGACNTACTGGQSCTSGKCACIAGQTLCSGTCIDTTTSNANCGACGMACTTGLTCNEGSCTSNSGADGCNGLALGITIQQIAAYQSVKIPIMTDGTALPPSPVNTTVPAAGQRNADVVVGRDTMFRVFVTVASDFTARQISARLTLTNGDASDQYFAKQTVSVSSVEADTTTTFQIYAPAAKIADGTQYRVELVECATGLGSTLSPQFPTTGSAPLSARDTGAVTIKVISILANGSAPDTTDASLDIYRQQFLAMYPITAVNMSFGDQITTDYPINWTNVLDQMRTKRAADAPAADVYYFGLLKPAATFAAFCGSSCTTGIGYVAGVNTPAQRAAVGIGFGDAPSAQTMTHEVGHNHGRNHAPCVTAGGTITGVDPNYPYANGIIGDWGFDPRSKTLLDPNKNTDIMGYCNNKWISDYTYEGLVNRVAAVNAAQDMFFDAQALATWRVLLLDARGPRWGLPITQPSLPEGSPILVSILDDSGVAITEVQAYRTEISDDASAMVMVPEPQPGWASVQAPGYAALGFSVPVSVPQY